MFSKNPTFSGSRMHKNIPAKRLWGLGEYTPLGSFGRKLNPNMVALRNRRIVIDDKPVLIFAGEIHYFRLSRAEWVDRIKKLKDLGCNAVASYIPWLIHEPRDGVFDLNGRFRPENDLGAFIDLCHEYGLWFIARPGPFIMAEMKNEGIPYWVYTKYPDAIPTSFRDEKATTHTLDFLNEGFLKAAERWYSQVMPLIASRLQTKGGPVISVQLDNEIGMLCWVSNQPDLSEDVLCDFAKWLGDRYSETELKSRYSFDLNDPAPRAKALRNPRPEEGPAFLRDYGDFERNRFARYVAKLRLFAENHGVRDVPFIVNIHGSGGGRGIQFPIGIHQLYEAYTQDDGYLPGSDHYLGDLTRDNAPDLYYINAFMAAVNRPEQPLSSVEFEVGSGDYGDMGSQRYSNAAADHKIRLSIAQGNRLLNYYLLAGGRNPHLLDPVGDGNDRVAFTGERHGFAAPINPEGELDPTYFGLKTTTSVMNAVAHKLADMDEEHDGMALAFLPEYYKTDFKIKGPEEEIVRGIESAREPLGTLTRGLLFGSFRFTGFDIQNQDPKVSQTPAIAFASCRYLDGKVQARLASYVEAGGKLFLFGEFPTSDMEGKPCSILGDRLGIKPAGIKESNERHHLAVKGVGPFADEPEVTLWRAQVFTEPSAGVLFRIVDTKAPTSIHVRVGKGEAIVSTGNFPAHVSTLLRMLELMGIRPGIKHNYRLDGLVTTTVANIKGERFLTVINLDALEKRFHLSEGGKDLFGGRAISLSGKDARLLPLGVTFGGVTVDYATTELLHVSASQLAFRATGFTETVRLSSTTKPTTNHGRVHQDGNHWLIETDRLFLDETIVVGIG